MKRAAVGYWPAVRGRRVRPEEGPGSVDPDLRSAGRAAGSTVPLKLNATIQPGWHLYSLTIPRPHADTDGGEG